MRSGVDAVMVLMLVCVVVVLVVGVRGLHQPADTEVEVFCGATKIFINHGEKL